LCEHFGLPEVAAYWQGVVEMNDWQKRRFTSRIVNALFNTVADKRIAVLGFAFKKDTNDTRESAAITVCRDLLGERAQVVVYDPKVSAEEIRRDVGGPSAGADCERLQVTASAAEACAGAHAVVVLTEWDEFKVLDFQTIYDGMSKPAFVFDGRNLLDHGALRQIGFRVEAIGKVAS